MVASANHPTIPPQPRHGHWSQQPPVSDRGSKRERRWRSPHRDGPRRFEDVFETGGSGSGGQRPRLLAPPPDALLYVRPVLHAHRVACAEPQDSPTPDGRTSPCRSEQQSGKLPRNLSRSPSRRWSRTSCWKTRSSPPRGRSPDEWMLNSRQEDTSFDACGIGEWVRARGMERARRKIPSLEPCECIQKNVPRNFDDRACKSSNIRSRRMYSRKHLIM